MARLKIKRKGVDWKELLGEEKEFFKNAIQEVVQEVLEAEMDDTVGARKGERTAERSGYLLRLALEFRIGDPARPVLDARIASLPKIFREHH